MFNLTIKPAQIEINLIPGAGFTQAYEIINNSNTILTLNTSVLPWQPIGTDGSINYENISQNQYISFSLNNSDLKLGENFILKPNQSKQIVLKAKSLPATPTQDHYFTFFINQINSSQTNSEISGGQALGRIGSHLLISTSPTEKTVSKINIKQINISPKVVDVFFPQISIKAIAHNESIYFDKIDSKISILKSDKLIDEIPIFPSNILAKSERNISCLSNNESIPCTIHPPYWPGVYTVQIDNHSTNFFVFPFSIVIFCTIIIFAIYSLLSKSKNAH